MLERSKIYIQRVWVETSLSDKLQLFSFIVGIVAMIFVFFQLRENTKTNKVSIRGQLYQSDFSLVNDEVSDENQSLMTIWTVVPPEVKGQEFATALVKLVSEDPTAQGAKTVEELYKSMFDFETFNTPERRQATYQLRRVFLHIQNTSTTYITPTIIG